MECVLLCYDEAGEGLRCKIIGEVGVFVCCFCRSESCEYYLLVHAFECVLLCEDELREAP